MRNCVIYKITNPSGHFYIGKAVNWTKRYSNYKRLDCKSQPALYNSFVEHGFKNHKIDFLEKNIQEKYLCGLEMMYIWAYRAFLDCEHLNCTEGGEGASGYKHTDEGKAKISKIHKGKKLSTEQIEATRQKNLGRKNTPETIARMSKSATGKVFSAEHRANISKAKIGTKASPETRKLQSEMRLGKKKKPMSEEQKKHLSIVKTGVKLSPEHCASISKSLIGRITSNDTKQKQQLGQKHRKMVRCIETQEIFQSIKSAAKEKGLSAGNLSGHLKGRHAHIAGLHFEYVNLETNLK